MTDRNAQNTTVVRSSFLNKVRGLALLKKGWDGADAEVPTADALVNAMEFCDIAVLAGLDVQEATALKHGGVAMNFSVGERVALGEFFNDGRIRFTINNADGETPTVIETTAGKELMSAARKVRLILKGK